MTRAPMSAKPAWGLVYGNTAQTEADIGAKLEHGVLSLSIPKKDEKKLPEKKVIMIEG